MRKPGGKPVEILLVEDNPGDVILTREAFKSFKLANNLHVAENGEKALKILRQEGEFADHIVPDLVLLDINLPRVNGKDVLKAIKEDEKLRTIPVIVLTGSKAERDVLETYKLYASGYIIKPLDIPQFAEAIRCLECFWFTVVTLPQDYKG